ncbi:hypothetical protein AB0G02_39545, partial [Actinosynnema sp. NPDC023658]|uniref:hypothetical protein n=1 Tax=Actinosynnema sp. NPDC023658 TaxID=3155465 RepID=UPI00340AB3D8
ACELTAFAAHWLRGGMDPGDLTSTGATRAQAHPHGECLSVERAQASRTSCTGRSTLRCTKE